MASTEKAVLGLTLGCLQPLLCCKLKMSERVEIEPLQQPKSIKEPRRVLSYPAPLGILLQDGFL